MGVRGHAAAEGVDISVVTTIVLLPIAVAAILVIVQDSLAVAFSLAGIAGLVRFRNALDDTRDAMYVVIAIAVGLGCRRRRARGLRRAGAVSTTSRSWPLEVEHRASRHRRYRPGRAGRARGPVACSMR